MSRGFGPRAEDDVGAEMLRLFRMLVLLAVPELGPDSRVQSELVDVVDTVPAPRRAVMRACRNGEIAGAASVGRRWIATRAAVEPDRRIVQQAVAQSPARLGGAVRPSRRAYS
jgi:hypothetical protein